MRLSIIVVLAAVVVMTTGACKDFITVDNPPGIITRPQVFSDDKTATAAMVGIYSNVMEDNILFDGKLQLWLSLCADDYSTTILNGQDDEQTYRNGLLSTSSATVSLWNAFYTNIYSTNAVLEGIALSQHITDSTRQRLQGEALFIRAFFYFYLMNIYGDVPFVTTTDYKLNAVMPRTPQDKIYTQLVSDLETATVLLTTRPYMGNTRPNVWAVKALLARVYLYRGEWEKAADAATSLIDNTMFGTLPPPAAVFLKNSREIIWQLVPIDPERGLFIPGAIIPISPNTNSSYPMTPGIMREFEKGDQRSRIWTKYIGKDSIFNSFAYKFKSTRADKSEFMVALRLGEQLLIRAEARLQLHQSIAAIADINTLRARAGLKPLQSDLQDDSLVKVIAHERRMELFGEWGHRWFDLKRTNKVDDVLQPLKQPNWQNTDVLWPIPKAQLEINPFLKQNPGYF